MNAKDPAQNPQIVQSLQSYLNSYLGYTSEEAVLASYLPANLDDLYDYMYQAGEVNWSPKIPEGTAQRISAFSDEVGVKLPQHYIEPSLPASLTNTSSPTATGSGGAVQGASAKPTGGPKPPGKPGGTIGSIMGTKNPAAPKK